MAKNFKMTIKTSNAAFEGESRPFELARILREVANDVEEGRTSGMLIDVNGAQVGTWSA